MNKIVKAIKKAVAKEVKKEEVSTVCTNCENSGKECRVCGFGTNPVV